MTKYIRHKNSLIVEGRLLAEGKQGQLTAEEWIYLYRQVEDHLVGGQAVVFSALESQIRKRYQLAPAEAVAV